MQRNILSYCWNILNKHCSVIKYVNVLTSSGITLKDSDQMQFLKKFSHALDEGTLENCVIYCEADRLPPRCSLFIHDSRSPHK